MMGDEVVFALWIDVSAPYDVRVTAQWSKDMMLRIVADEKR
jgi:hypothetical protein